MTRHDDNAGAQGLRALERELERDLALLNYPPEGWVSARFDEAGRELVDVAIVGAGLCGLTAAFSLLRHGVTRVRVFDTSPAGVEGPWVTYARMRTLRSPKHLTGPALGLPRLTFRAWFEAQWGAEAWGSLDRIAREQWMEYLRWYRRVLSLPVENLTRVVDIAPGEQGLRLRLEQAGDERTMGARKVVLATGREGLARPRIPAAFEPFLDGPCHHSSQDIDFAALAGRRVVVIGLGASAMDNAAVALEAGAHSVHLLARAAAMPRINKAKSIVYAGFTHGFPALSERERLEIMRYIAACRVAPPRSALARVAAFDNFHLRLDSEVHAVHRDEDGLTLQTAGGRLHADAVILATGFRIDVDGAPELGAVARHIKRWGDLPSMSDVDPGEEYLGFPVLGRSLEFQPRDADAAPWLGDLHCFNLAAQLSHGNVSSDIPAVSEGAERLARGICRDLFLSDRVQHMERLHAYEEPELLGDELALSAWWPPL